MSFDDMGYIINNIGIRHPEDDFIKGMKQIKLEEWQDKTYAMLLLCMLANNHIDIKKGIKEIKSRSTQKVANQ